MPPFYLKAVNIYRKVLVVYMKRRISFVIMIISLAVLGGSLGYLGKCYIDRQNAVGTMNKLADEYVSRVDDTEDGDDATGDFKPSEKITKGKKKKLRKKVPVINWKGMNVTNKDIVAWVEIPDTNISYPVLQTDNDDYYLSHNIDGEENPYGAIFLSCINSPDFSDSHNIVFGHNMSDGTMFNNLNKYGDKNYYLSHPYIYIYTPKYTYIYQIYSVYQAKIDDVSFTYDVPLGSDLYKEQLTLIKGLSEYDTGTRVSKKKPMVTLITCNAYLDYSSRTSVHGILIDKVKNKQ